MHKLISNVAFLLVLAFPAFGQGSQVTWKSPGTEKCYVALKLSNGHEWPLNEYISKLIEQSVAKKCSIVTQDEAKDEGVAVIHSYYYLSEIQRWEAYPGISIGQEAKYGLEAVLAGVLGEIARRVPNAVGGAIGGISGHVWGDANNRWYRYPDQYIKYQVKIVTNETLPDGPPEELALSDGQYFFPRKHFRSKKISTVVSFLIKFEQGGVGPFRATLLAIDGSETKKIRLDGFWQEGIILIATKIHSLKFQTWTPFKEVVVREFSWRRSLNEY